MTLHTASENLTNKYHMFLPWWRNRGT